MAKLEINLHEAGGDVIIKQEHVSGQKYLDFWNMQEELEKGKSNRVEQISKQLEYIASLFNDKDITAERILKGLDPWEIEGTINTIVSKVLGIEGKDEKKAL